MNKLRLELDDLHVDTFATSGAARGEGGTVRGYNVTRGPSYDEPCIPDYTDTCPPTQYYTCATACGSCYNSCYGSCQNTCYTCWQNTCANASCDPCYPIE